MFSSKKRFITYGYLEAHQVESLVSEGWTALEQGNVDCAIDYANRVLIFDPDRAQAALILGIAQRTKDPSAAFQTLKHAVALAPFDARAHYHYGLSLAERGDHNLAMLELQACLKFDPEDCDAHWKYGLMLYARNHDAKALEQFSKVVVSRSDKRHQATYYMALCCSHIEGLESRANTLFTDYLAANNDPAAHLEYAKFLLRHRQFTEAWPHYVRRFEVEQKGCQLWLVNTLSIKAWDGRFSKGVLIVHNEVNAGDDIFFAAFIPALLDRALPVGLKVILLCRPPLVAIYQASFRNAFVISYDNLNLQGLGEWTRSMSWQVAIGDLPRFIAKPPIKAYLIPHPDDVSLIRSEMARMKFNNTERKVGLMWSTGDATHQEEGSFSDTFLPLVNAFARPSDDVHFVGLQTGDDHAGLADLVDIRITDMSSVITNYSQLAATMLQMDYVITVCSPAANLAGALGINTRILLKRNADWRWQFNDTWYLHIQCYKQAMDGDWSVPIRNIFRKGDQRQRAQRKPTDAGKSVWTPVSASSDEFLPLTFKSIPL